VELSEDLPLLRVDANLIVQLLSNLLDNAIKYTPPATRIEFSACHDGSRMRLVVEDAGPGLGLEDPDKLFEKFARARSHGNPAVSAWVWRSAVRWQVCMVVKFAPRPVLWRRPL